MLKITKSLWKIFKNSLLDNDAINKPVKTKPKPPIETVLKDNLNLF
jgi:hypothetical protein